MLIIESTHQGNMEKNLNEWDNEILNPLFSESGLLKMLIWPFAPIAIEICLHPQLIVSDPREAQGLIRRLVEKSNDFGFEQEFVNILPLQNMLPDKNELKDLMKRAFAEADFLLRNNKAAVSALTERLIGGAATVGD
jgi:hypothetical protein